MELLVAPGLIEVAGPRLHIRPFEGLPLLLGRAAALRGLAPRGQGRRGPLGRRSSRSSLLAPVLAGHRRWPSRLDQPGPGALPAGAGRRERPAVHDAQVPQHGRRRRPARLDAAAHGNVSDGLLFKMRDDPRVTPVGRVAPPASLDELPQLINVLSGSMSLVGPRPPLPQRGRALRRRRSAAGCWSSRA